MGIPVDFLGDLFGPYFVEEGSSEHNVEGKIRHATTKKEVWVHTGNYNKNRLFENPTFQIGSALSLILFL